MCTGVVQRTGWTQQQQPGKQWHREAKQWQRERGLWCTPKGLCQAHAWQDSASGFADRTKGNRGMATEHTVGWDITCLCGGCIWGILNSTSGFVNRTQGRLGYYGFMWGLSGKYLTLLHKKWLILQSTRWLGIHYQPLLLVRVSTYTASLSCVTSHVTTRSSIYADKMMTIWPY